MNNYLEHHGVDGQKWGKKNGPPYPLNRAGRAELRRQRRAAKRNRGRSDVEDLSFEDMQQKTEENRKKKAYVDSQNDLVRSKNTYRDLHKTGREKVADAMASAALKGATAVFESAITKAGNALIDKAIASAKKKK